MQQASPGIRLLVQPSSNFMLPSAFQGGGESINRPSKRPPDTNERLQLAVDDQTPRNVTFQVSCNVMMPSTSSDKGPTVDTGDTEHLIGYRNDPQLKERQRQQQPAESQAANAPKDLRAKINANERARDQFQQGICSRNLRLSN